MPDRIRVVWPEVPALDEWSPYLQQSIEQNWHTNSGPAAQQLETRLGAMFAFEGEAVIAMCSATAALSACLIAHNIRGPVICPAFTFQATAGAILGAGCQPFITDVDVTTGVVTADTLRAALQDSGAKAAMLVVPYGIEVDLSEQVSVCEELGARLIIDNAAGLGPGRKSRSMTSLPSHVDEVFSLHATKVFGIGEGGAVFSSTEHVDALRSAINFGLNSHTATGETVAPFWGINGKMAEAMAAVGLAVADRFVERVTARQAMAKRWIDALSKTQAHIFCSDPARAPWQVFPILLENDDAVTEFSARMSNDEIGTRRYYSPSLGACKGMASHGPCPNAGQLAERAVVVPMRSWMSVDEQEDLIGRTVAILNHMRSAT